MTSLQPSRTPPESSGPARLLNRLRPQGIRLGLERPRRLLATLGDPQRACPVVLVAGTNGKGSTAHLLAAMLDAAGLRTGLFTSPALEGPEEQIRIAGANLDPEALEGLLQRVLKASGEALGGHPTPFEALTAAAYLAFAGAHGELGKMDLAVVECGMGGARDATNVADAELALLTTVGLEHRGFLGSSREAIAREKAGIFRPGRPAVVGRLTPDAEPAEADRVMEAVQEEARRIGAELHRLDEEVTWETSAPDRGPMAGDAPREVSLRTPVGAYRIQPALAGEHQLANLALAVRGLELLARRQVPTVGPALDRSSLRSVLARGASSCRVPGRLEWLEPSGPDIPPGRRVLLDVAHDPQAVAALLRYLDDEGLSARSRDSPDPLDLLFGVLEDKDAAAMLEPLERRCRRVVLTRPSDPRARDPRELRRLSGEDREGAVEVEVVPEPHRALERALAELPARGTLLVCGSVVLVGEVRRRLRASQAG